MKQDDLSAPLLVLLVLLSGVHGGFGKNLPKAIWILSIASSLVAGIYIGFSIAPFPNSIFTSILFSCVFIGGNVILRLTRRNHDI